MSELSLILVKHLRICNLGLQKHHDVPGPNKESCKSDALT